jgi:uncharacterized protein (UPF0548 family)
LLSKDAQMFLLTKPSASFIEQYLKAQKTKSFSYSEVGASLASAPSGYLLDHNRAKLGCGLADYDSAKQAIISWKMFDFSWLQLCWTDAPIVEGTTVAVVVEHFGFWSINSCRIVYLIREEKDHFRRFGFAYGTLDDHAERGEERFLVEWNQSDDSVWYDVLAFSRPNKPLAFLGYPWARALQKRFAVDSMRAMENAVNQSHPSRC